MSSKDTDKTGIWHWKLGDVALARMCKKVYARVRVTIDEKGLFYDYKVLGISGNEDGSISVTKKLCYFVETCRTNQKLWLPYTCMFLAERSRPFYGSDNLRKGDGSPVKVPQSNPRKRKPKEEHIVPLNVKILKFNEPDLNTTYDIRHMPLKQGKYENAFKEFIRRGKEMLFDEYFNIIQSDPYENTETLDYLLNVDASTEDKLELVIKNIVSEKEIEKYLHQCWRYNFVHKQSVSEARELVDSTNLSSESKPQITVHISWCLVCGQSEKLRACVTCPASFHLSCRKEWLLTIIHRKSPPKKSPAPATLVKKVLSSTRIKTTVHKHKENMDLCPSCMWGPKIGYDDVVWHKLGSCGWWPARVLTPGELPHCLLARTRAPQHWPLRYYGTLNHSWGETTRMCLFLPSHTAGLANREPTIKKALMDACDDYIAVYLT